jgi:hypothetical protein
MMHVLFDGSYIKIFQMSFLRVLSLAMFGKTKYFDFILAHEYPQSMNFSI